MQSEILILCKSVINLDLELHLELVTIQQQYSKKSAYEVKTTLPHLKGVSEVRRLVFSVIAELRRPEGP